MSLDQQVGKGPAVLVLEDGFTLTGTAFGALGHCVGEAVFCTAMTGYQETLTDPSYHRQVIIMTAPHIGNTGMNDDDAESRQIWAAGFVVRDLSRRVSNWRAQRSLDDDLEDAKVVGIYGVDTRALTRRLRSAGVMRVGVFSGDNIPDEAARLQIVRDAPTMAGANLAVEVTTDAAYVVPAVGEKKFTVAALDVGIKSMTPRMMAERGMEVHVLPADSSIDDVLAVKPDGIFASNGPGDPGATDAPIAVIREVLERKIPFFGICLGNQLLGRALGLGTYKLPFGHRGINQPVIDTQTTKVEITAQNHGFAVDAPLMGEFSTEYGAARVSHIGLNDQVVEGIECLDVPAFSVQYHPEASAGPHDSAYLFDRFADLMTDPSGGTR